MNKIILVHYVSMAKINEQGNGFGHRAKYLQQYQALMNRNVPDGILQYMIPTDEPNTRIECINPQLISGEEMEIVNTKVAKFKEKMDEWLKTNGGD
jgi:hypothetical protein